jgi:hypothetical protein
MLRVDFWHDQLHQERPTASSLNDELLQPPEAAAPSEAGSEVSFNLDSASMSGTRGK